MFQVGADGWKEGCTNIFFRASHIYYWSLGINFRAYAKMVKVDCLRREFLQTLFSFEAATTFCSFAKEALWKKGEWRREGIVREWQA